MSKNSSGSGSVTNWPCESHEAIKNPFLNLKKAFSSKFFEFIKKLILHHKCFFQ
jgi:hypothetical protein